MYSSISSSIYLPTSYAGHGEQSSPDILFPNNLLQLFLSSNIPAQRCNPSSISAVSHAWSIRRHSGLRPILSKWPKHLHLLLWKSRSIHSSSQINRVFTLGTSSQLFVSNNMILSVTSTVLPNVCSHRWRMDRRLIEIQSFGSAVSSLAWSDVMAASLQPIPLKVCRSPTL